jgi:hypothetical protein
MSLRDICRSLGYGTSGQQRKLLAKKLDDALFHFWEGAVSAYGNERAACLLAHMLAKDTTYEPDLWAVQVIKRHREAIQEEFFGEPERDQDPYKTMQRRARNRFGDRE